MGNPQQMTGGLKRSPLDEAVRDAGGRMVTFAGWEMAVQYGGQLKEHQAVRERCGIFDISHMGVLRLKGPGAKDHLQALVPTDLFRIGPGEACYTVLLNEKAGIIDDLIMYDRGWSEQDEAHELLLVVNASRTETDLRWLEDRLAGCNCEVEDFKENKVLVALQGPAANRVLSEIMDQDMTDLPAFGHRMRTSPKIGQAFIARTGYTGEDGFELLMDAEAGRRLWQESLNRGVEPCGLGARDMLRLEAGMLLYGSDMDETTSPLESGLGWLIHLEMPKEFIGRRTLEDQTSEGVDSCLISLTVDGKAIPRAGCNVVVASQTGKEIVGKVTSGGWSPKLNKGIALARIKVLAKEKDLKISIRGKDHKAAKSKKSFLKAAT